MLAVAENASAIAVIANEMPITFARRLRREENRRVLVYFLGAVLQLAPVISVVEMAS